MKKSELEQRTTPVDYVYSSANSPKRGVAVLEIPAEAYASPITTDYRKITIMKLFSHNVQIY